jgi:hypothetical protein
MDELGRVSFGVLIGKYASQKKEPLEAVGAVVQQATVPSAREMRDEAMGAVA